MGIRFRLHTALPQGPCFFCGDKEEAWSSPNLSVSSLFTGVAGPCSPWSSWTSFITSFLYSQTLLTSKVKRKVTKFYLQQLSNHLWIRNVWNQLVTKGPRSHSLFKLAFHSQMLQCCYIVTNRLTGIPGLIIELLPGDQGWSFSFELFSRLLHNNIVSNGIIPHLCQSY